ncbi:DsbE family thiol:disulfide interchange protein, partial [Rhizobium ruizarguesonis]
MSETPENTAAKPRGLSRYALALLPLVVF